MSNYRNKKKGVKGTAKKLGDPVFLYTCHCHDEKAGKKPCSIDSDTQFSDRNKPEHSLGSWTCKLTGKKCKVNRTKNKVEEITQEAI